MIIFYILDGKAVKPVATVEEWARWFQKAGKPIRHIGDDTISGIRVSTVFLGIDHSFGESGPPIVFETMVFGGPLDQVQERYATYEEAFNGHMRWMARVREEQTLGAKLRNLWHLLLCKRR